MHPPKPPSPTPIPTLLKPHTSRLPGPLYILSFAPPFPSPLRDLRGCVKHPYTLYAVGTLAAMICGVGIPAFDILYGYWTTGITASQASPSELISRGSHSGWLMTIVGGVMLIAFTVFLACFVLAGISVSDGLREVYFASIISQDAPFFDRVGGGEVATRAQKDVNLIRTAFGEKVGYVVWSTALAIAAFVSSFVQSPRLAGVLFSLIPFTLLAVAVVTIFATGVNDRAAQVEGQSSTYIEQVISSARIVQAFGMSQRLLVTLETNMFRPMRKLGVKRAAGRAGDQTAAFSAVWLSYALAFYMGGIEVTRGLPVGHVLTCFYNTLNLLFAIAGAIPHVLSVMEATTAINVMRRQIERKPLIDSRDTSGLILPTNGDWKPSFSVQNLTFAYPGRPSTKTLDDVSLEFPPGKMIAIVGPSGSGKSSLASLLLREYDPETANLPRDDDVALLKAMEEQDAAAKKAEEKNAAKLKKKQEKERLKAGGLPDNEKTDEAEDALEEGEGKEKSSLERVSTANGIPIKGGGQILFAGHDIRTLNLSWLRSQVAVVSQNPCLFNGSILDNVAAGLTGTELEYRPDEYQGELSKEQRAKLDAITERCEEALQKAEALEFVQALPKGIMTEVSGARTGVLSGGQLQRVALARALSSRPACLLLDEATSAIAADAEAKIIETLNRERAERGMCVIMIAHRLSTIVASDNIAVIQAGRLVAQGTFQQLTDPSYPNAVFRNMTSSHAAPVETAKAPLAITAASSSEALSHSMAQAIPAESATHIALDMAATEGAILGPRLRKAKTVFSRNKWLLIGGTFAGLAVGGSFAIAAWLNGNAVHSLSISGDNSRLRRETDWWSLWFFILAIFSVVVLYFNAFPLEVAAAHINVTLQKESLRALVRQDIPFFESEEGGSGSLTASIAQHPGYVSTPVGLVYAQCIQAFANLLSAFILGFTLNAKVTAVGLPAVALVIVFGGLNFTYIEKFEKMVSEEGQRRANFINEVVNNVRTVAALTREKEMLRRFLLDARTPAGQRKALVLGTIGFGISQGMIYLFAAFLFWWAAVCLARGQATIIEIFAVSEAIQIATFISGRLLTFVGDFSRMASSLKVIQSWLDREPAYAKIEDELSNGSSSSLATLPTSADRQKGIVFSNVELRYPSRPTIPAISNLNLTIPPSSTIAICGASGSGKSSVIALLMRFFETTQGRITIDGRDIRVMKVETLREMIGLVPQEPVLFEGTVAFNLSLGALNPDAVTRADLEWACEQACILDFVRGLKHGFDTELGIKGAQLSGGQRQRLCIARALLRKPQILLFDEATSALDNESQAKVQQAIENISRGRTVITVAHRLQAIAKADIIFLMEAGRVIEQGRHEELVERGGRYLELVQAQL